MDGILNDLNIKYLRSLRSKLDPILEDISNDAKKNEVPVVSYEVGKFLEIMTLIKDPENVLEIGTAVGFSGIFIARALKTSGKLTTIDSSASTIEVAKKNFTRAGVINKVNLIVEDAKKALKTLKTKFDMAFIDAKKEDYKYYLTSIIKLMNHGGVIIIDNLLWHGQTAGGPLISDDYMAATAALKKFNSFFLKHPDITSTILAVGDGTGLAIVK
jgi:predicted O-methyltransferase YrrM